MELAGGLWLLVIGFVLGTVCGSVLVSTLRRRQIPDGPAGAVSVEEDARRDDEASFIDPATGLASRRYVEMFLSKEISRSERLGKPVSAAVFDVDDFRTLARDAGRDAVDAALGEMGQRLRALLRDYDVIGRYSDGRLVVVLPESSVEQAVEAAARLLGSLGSLRLAGKLMSVSVGLATFPDHASNAEELLNSAHHALNTGRASGSNSRIHCSRTLAKAS
ncbi:MAG: GGDEF domain-containing protein [Armatimonadota bacterium]